MNITHREITTTLSEAEFCSWLSVAAPGNVIEYHRGFLVLDAAQPCREKLALKRQQELIQLRRRAYWAAERELVHLVQRRLAPCRFSYLAIKRSSQLGSSAPDQMVKPCRSGNATAAELQVRLLRSRYALSVPLAISVAELAFSNGGVA
ncbi:hypothetical protein NKI15_18690 [Mesorhizobium sp. M0862]|uniref:hypothetical protein n=1 Tax=Mesorhizobium sp. M0862 TaxID=2957015 RepID=UPI00333880EC